MKNRIRQSGVIIALIALIFSLPNTTSAFQADNLRTHTLSVVGFAQGQSVQLHIANPNALRKGQPSPIVRARILVRDSRGRLIMQTEETLVPASESRAFKFNLDEHKAAGEPGVASLFEIQWVTSDPLNAESLQDPLLSVDLVENSTGKVLTLVTRSSPERSAVACWSFCSSLLCVHVCLHPFASFVTANPPG